MLGCFLGAEDRDDLGEEFLADEVTGAKFALFWETVAGLEVVLQMRYSLVVILKLNGGSEVQYKDMIMVDDRKYQ